MSFAVEEMSCDLDDGFSSLQEEFLKKNVVKTRLLHSTLSGILLRGFLHEAREKMGFNLAFEDGQVFKAVALTTSIIGTTLLESSLQTVSKIVGKTLVPAQAYGRLYLSGAKLEKHVDREHYEFAASVCLGYESLEPWAILMDEKPFSLLPGEAVVYSGPLVPHERLSFNGKWHAQIFLGFVAASGPFCGFAFDGLRWCSLKEVQGNFVMQVGCSCSGTFLHLGWPVGQYDEFLVVQKMLQCGTLKIAGVSAEGHEMLACAHCMDVICFRRESYFLLSRKSCELTLGGVKDVALKCPSVIFKAGVFQGCSAEYLLAYFDSRKFMELPYQNLSLVFDSKIPIHYGFMCNGAGCQEIQLRGTRFRCETCLDFNLCSLCHEFNRHLHHKDHSFEAIVQPDEGREKLVCFPSTHFDIIKE